MISKRFVTILAAVLTLFSLPAYGLQGHIDRLDIGTTMEVKNVGIGDRTFGLMMGILSHRSLTRFSADGSIVGDLASSWETHDATSWIFHLRPGTTWHDGKLLTADDVVFTYKYLIEKIPAYIRHFNLLEDIDATDPLTVRIRLKQPNSRFMVNVCGIEILPMHIYRNVDDPRVFFGPRAAIGSGPFVFQSFDANNGLITFSAYAAYKPEKPVVDMVRFHVYKNKDTLNLALKKGIVDLPYSFPMENDASSLMFLKKSGNLSFFSTENMGLPNALFFNTQKSPMDNPEMRRALSMAIDYQKMIDLISGGYGHWPNTGIVPPGMHAYFKTEPFLYSPEKAEEKLKDLGYEDNDGDGILDKGGIPLSIDCMIMNESTENRRAAELLKRDFDMVGVNFIPRYVDANVFQTMVNREKNYTMILHRTTSWGMMSWAGCGTAYIDERNMGWTSTVDGVLYRMIDRLNGAVSEEDYVRSASDLQKYYSENIFIIPLFWNTLVFPYNNRLSGWKTDCFNGILNLDSWFSLKAR